MENKHWNLLGAGLKFIHIKENWAKPNSWYTSWLRNIGDLRTSRQRKSCSWLGLDFLICKGRVAIYLIQLVGKTREYMIELSYHLNSSKHQKCLLILMLYAGISLVISSLQYNNSILNTPKLKPSSLSIKIVAFKNHKIIYTRSIGSKMHLLCLWPQ